MGWSMGSSKGWSMGEPEGVTSGEFGFTGADFGVDLGVVIGVDFGRRIGDFGFKRMMKDKRMVLGFGWLSI